MHPSMTEEKPEVKEWALKVTDRCDSCGAQALVEVTGINGSLLFCGHHYNNIMNDQEGYKKMMSFMISIVDEREKFTENKAKGDSY